MREQIAQQPPRRRASLPPEERTASWHHDGTRSGVHPEDQPHLTATRNYHAPTTERYFEIDEEGEDVYTRPPMRTSTRRYDLAPYARGERRTEELPRQGKHPLFYIGLFLVILVGSSPLLSSFRQPFRNGAMIEPTATRAPIKPTPMLDMEAWSIFSR